MTPSTQRKARSFGPLTVGTLLAGTIVALSVVAYRTWPSIHEWHLATTSIEALSDQKTQTQALTTLIDLGPAAAPYLRGALHHKDEAVRVGASTIMLKLGPAELQQAVGDLIAALNDPCAEVRVNSAKAIGRIAPYETNAEDIRHLIATLSSNVEHEDPLVQQAAIKSLRAFGSAAEITVPLFEKMLGHEDRGIRVEAARAILQVSPQGRKEPIVVLFRILRDETDNSIRQPAGHGLHELKPDSLQFLLETMRDIEAEEGEWAGNARRPDQRWSLLSTAASALWRMGERFGRSVKAALPDLARLRCDADPQVREWARRAMESIDASDGSRRIKGDDESTEHP